MDSLFDNLTNDERKLLEHYDIALKSGELKRSSDEAILDKIFILSSARLMTNTTRKGKQIDSDYINRVILEYKTNQVDYSNPHIMNIYIGRLYESKKYANYDRREEGLYTSNDAQRKITSKGQCFTDYLTQNSNNGTINIKKDDGSGWIYRISDDYVKGKIDHRYAINAKPNIELIKQLDNYTKKYNMHYKTCLPINWHDRNDSIVIYCSNPQTQEEIDELKKITKPFIRRSIPSRVNDLDGTLVSDGLVMAKEVDVNMCKELYAELKVVCPSLAQALIYKLNENESKNKLNPLSLGQYTAYKSIISTIKSERLKNNNQHSHATDKAKSKEEYHIRLKEESRLSFAPNITDLYITEGEKGEIYITGTSKDSKQSIVFRHIKGVSNIELSTEKGANEYSNKDGEWKRIDLKSPNRTKYIEETGALYTKELAKIIHKKRELEKSNSQLNTIVTKRQASR